MAVLYALLPHHRDWIALASILEFEIPEVKTIHVLFGSNFAPVDMRDIRRPVPPQVARRLARDRLYYRAPRSAAVPTSRGFEQYQSSSRRASGPPQPAAGVPSGPSRRIQEIQEIIQNFKDFNLRSQVMTGTAHSLVRPTDQKHPKPTYRPGVVFSAPHHTPCGIEFSEVSVFDLNRTASPYGCIYSKYRKFVVIQQYETGVSCLPIYSHNGKGLENPYSRDEWVSIRDVSDEVPEPAESAHGVVLCTTHGYKGATVVKGKSSIHLTETTNHRYDSYASIEGHMPKDEFARLCSLVMNVTFGNLQAWADSPATVDTEECHELEEGEIME